jgi:GNAT superfamily N-acetyltransferase
MSFILPDSIQQATSRIKSRGSHANIVVMGESQNRAASSADDSEVLVRSIDRRDAREVALLVEQLGYQRSPDAVVAWIETLTAQSAPAQTAFVACLGEEVVGWVEVSLQSHLQSPPFALIGGLVVKDGARGKGIGKLLCGAAEAWSWERSVSVVRVTSRSTRPDAHRFYSNNGFESTKISHVFEKKRPE